MYLNRAMKMPGKSSLRNLPATKTAQRPISSSRDPKDIAFFERQIGKALAECNDDYAKYWLERLFEYRRNPATGLSAPPPKPTDLASLQRMIGHCVSTGQDANGRWWLSQLSNYRR